MEGRRDRRLSSLLVAVRVPEPEALEVQLWVQRQMEEAAQIFVETIHSDKGRTHRLRQHLASRALVVVACP